MHIIFAITATAMDRIATMDAGFYRRITDKSTACNQVLENPNDEEELFGVIKDILGEAGAKMDIRGGDEDEIRNVCKVVYDKKKERPLSESLTFFNTLFEMVDGNSVDIKKSAYELVGEKTLQISPEPIVIDGAERSKEIEKAIRSLCFKLKEMERIRKVHPTGKRIYLKKGWKVADVFFEDNEGKIVAGEVKVRREFLESSNLHIPEIMREGFLKEGGKKKRVDRAIIWYLVKGLSDEVEREIEELRREDKEVDEVKMEEREVEELMKKLKDKEVEKVGVDVLEMYGKKLRIIKQG
jgi:hypothetical protein